MAFLTELWLPITLSAVAVFFASWVAWMFLPHHKPDFHTLADEPRLLASLKEQGITPGFYLFPNCDMKDMKDPAKRAAWEAGPHGHLTLRAAKPNFGRNLALVFCFYLLICLLTAYVTREARLPGADFGAVMQVAATTAFMGYALGGIPNGVFFGRTARAMAMDVIDGLLFALITGLIFAAMWPDA